MKIFLQCGKPKVMNPIRSKPICFVLFLLGGGKVGDKVKCNDKNGILF